MTTQEEIDLRKKEKKIDRNHWMCRLQLYTFGIDAPAYYMGYCPFFWMTWVSLLALPFIWIFDIVSAPANFIWNKCTSPILYCRTSIAEKRNNTPKRPSHYHLLHIEDWLDEDEPTSTISFQKFLCRHYHATLANRYFLWFCQNPNWRTEFLPEAKAFSERELEREFDECRGREEKRNKRTQVRLSISLCGAAIFKVLIPLVIITVGVATLVGLYQLIMMLSIEQWLFCFIGLMGVWSTLLFVKICWSGFSIYRDFYIESLDANIEPWPVRYAIGICKGLSWVGSKFADVYDFIRETISMTYKQECPLIIWGEETGKIEKRCKTTQSK